MPWGSTPEKGRLEEPASVQEDNMGPHTNPWQREASKLYPASSGQRSPKTLCSFWDPMGRQMEGKKQEVGAFPHHTVEDKQRRHPHALDIKVDSPS